MIPNKWMLGLFGAIIVFAGCTDSATDSDAHDHGSTFELIQTRLFNTSCAVSGCHAGATPTGGMSLEDGVAYGNLINISPSNTAARTDGFLRVRPGMSDSSFLYRKLAGLLGPDHGARMPLGSAALDSGWIQFVREWIEAGAPEAGSVADPGLIGAGDEMFAPLAPPDHGFQLHVPAFDVPPQSNREIFYYQRTPNELPVYVNKFEVRMRNHSHHFILYSYDALTGLPSEGVTRELGDEMENFDKRGFILGAQEASFDYQFPPGVAVEIPAHQGVDLNSHYVNPGDATIKGEVYVNLHTVDHVDRIAYSLLYPTQNFVLPPKRTTVVRDTVPATFNADVFMLTSHMHERGKSFKAYIVGGPDDGKLIYENYDWQSPVLKPFDPPLHLQAGQGIAYEATYDNQTDRTIRWGYTSEDEMCILVGYYAIAN